MSSKGKKIADAVKQRKRQAAKGDAYEGPDRSSPPAKARKLMVGRIVSEVESLETEWLWKGYLPLGKLCIFDGDPDKGKSMVTCAIAAAVTTGGQFPDLWDAPKGGVILINAEDTTEDTVRGRLEAAGADMNHVLHIEEIPSEGGNFKQLTFPDDIHILADCIDQMNAKLVVIDPITTHFSAKENVIQDASVRRVLGPLKLLAAQKKCCILMVRHVSKDEDKSPLNKGAGSIAFVALSRVALIAGIDPENEACRVMAINKCNICVHARPQRYQIETAPNGYGFVRWLGTSTHTTKSIFANQVEDQEDKSALHDAQIVLKEILKDGKVEANEVFRLGIEAGVSKITMKRAKASLQVGSERGLGEDAGKWFWTPPFKP